MAGSNQHAVLHANIDYPRFPLFIRDRIPGRYAQGVACIAWFEYMPEVDPEKEPGVPVDN